MSVLTIVDHASNHVPNDIDLEIAPEILATHIAWDIGASPLADALGYASYKATVTRLVIDMNREAHDDGLVPLASDGVEIAGNRGETGDRIERFWKPYHEGLARRIALQRPTLLLSLHSFTPSLSSRPGESRPWEVGVLYNLDDRAARLAIPLLHSAGVVIGNQLPYSGRVLNATMNRHAEATGTPYLGLEVRQDLITGARGIAHWAAVLRPIIDAVLTSLAATAKAR